MVDILGRPDVAERGPRIQMEPVTRTRAQAAAFFAEETELWGKVIKQANIRRNSPRPARPRFVRKSST